MRALDKFKAAMSLTITLFAWLLAITIATDTSVPDATTAFGATLVAIMGGSFAAVSAVREIAKLIRAEARAEQAKLQSITKQQPAPSGE